MNETLNIIITGIGGQGTVSIGHILGKIFTDVGYHVVAAETHGMSQRGGSVVFHLRIGKNYGPIIPKGQADVIISGEPMESLRVIDYLKPNGIVISNTHGILSPVAANLGQTYPSVEKIFETVREWPAALHIIDTGNIAKELGITQGENLILMGAFLKLSLIDLDTSYVEETIKARWPKFAENNMKALHAGYMQIEEKLVST